MDEPHPRKCKARISIDDRPAYQVNVHSAVNSWVFEEFSLLLFSFSLLLSLYTLSLSLFFCPPLVLCFFAHFSDLRRCLMNIIKRNHQQLGWINLAMAFCKWQEELRWSWVIDRRHTSSAVRLSKDLCRFIARGIHCWTWNRYFIRCLTIPVHTWCWWTTRHFHCCRLSRTWIRRGWRHYGSRLDRWSHSNRVMAENTVFVRISSHSELPVHWEFH